MLLLYWRDNIFYLKYFFSGNDFTDKEAEFFAEAFEENKYLKHINLSRNYFGELSGEILGPALG